MSGSKALILELRRMLGLEDGSRNAGSLLLMTEAMIQSPKSDMPIMQPEFSATSGLSLC
jgi:hypothetical protein